MKTKKLLNYLLTLIILLGFACENNTDEPVIDSNNDVLTGVFFTKTVSFKEIPEITSFFENKTKKGIFTAKTDSEVVFDIENIIEVVDTLRNSNYTFNFTLNDSPENVVYNLVIGVDSLGVKTAPIVLKYTCDEEYFEHWQEDDFDFGSFTGTLNQYVYKDFFESDLFAKSDCSEFDEFGDPTPCVSEAVFNGNINNDGGSSSGGGASTGGGPGPSTSGGCTYNNTFHTCGGSNQYTAHGSEGCGGDGGGSYWVMETTCPNGNNSTTTTQKDDCDCNQGPSGGISLLNIANKNSFLIEYKIESTQLDPCSSKILNELKGLQQNDIAKIISRFGTPNSVYDWELKTAIPTNPNNVAETNWAVDNNGNAIDNSYLTVIKASYSSQATSLAIARTILHEAIHAYIISYIDDLAGGNTQGFSTEFPDLWNNFVSKKYGVPADNIEDYQHQEMAVNFVDIIGDALAEYDNNQQDSTYYEFLAWGALIDTDAFSSALGPGGNMTQSEQEAILIANNQEDTNGPVAKGTPCP